MAAARFLFPALILFCCLSSCGRESNRCSIDCEDTSRPESRQMLRDETNCDDCRDRYRELKSSLCGATPNPDCYCLYTCEDSSQFP